MEKPLLPSSYHADSPKVSLMPRKSPALLLGAALSLILSACSSPDSEPPAETSTSSSATSTSSATSSSSTTSSTTTSSEEAMTEEPADSVAAEPETQPQAAAAEPELLYCDPGNLTIIGTFSDGTERPTELCDTPSHRRSVRAEAVCGGLDGRYKYPEEWAELCNGGLPPSDSGYPDSYGDIDTGYAPESGAVTDAPADSDTGAVEGYEY